MTIIEKEQFKVCTFCWDFHQQYMKGVSFNFANKLAVTDCRLCDQAMCAGCEASSQKELQKDVLSAYGLTMCQRCITQVWRLTTAHQEYERILHVALEKLKAGLRKEIYHLTQTQHAYSDRHV
jgi:hypothetical protein